MAKFIFKYEAMKRYRTHRLLVAKKELLGLESKILELKSRMASAVQERSADIGSSVNMKVVTAAQFLLYPDLVEIQNKRIANWEQELRWVEEEYERHARWVAQLGQELRIVEKLEEKQREIFAAEERLIEKRRGDRWVAERWQRGSS